MEKKQAQKKIKGPPPAPPIKVKNQRGPRVFFPPPFKITQKGFFCIGVFYFFFLFKLISSSQNVFFFFFPSPKKIYFLFKSFKGFFWPNKKKPPSFCFVPHEFSQAFNKGPFPKSIPEDFILEQI